VLPFVAPGQRKILVRHLLRLLNKSVQQHQAGPFIDVEKHPRYAVLRQTAPYFIYATTQGPAHWHADWPAELQCLPRFASGHPAEAPSTISERALRLLPCDKRSPDILALIFTGLRLAPACRLRPLAHRGIVPYKVQVKTHQETGLRTRTENVELSRKSIEFYVGWITKRPVSLDI
jgi:hypothetical protein